MSYEAADRESWLTHGEPLDETWKSERTYHREVHLCERVAAKPCRPSLNEFGEYVSECEGDPEHPVSCARHGNLFEIVSRWMRRYAPTR
jgi:hypothetical protein